MNKQMVASELLRVSKLLMADDDVMKDEKLSSLYVKFHTWATKEATSKNPGSPVATQILKGMSAVNKALKGKEGLTGREAVVALLKAMKGDFTKSAQPIPYLMKTYGQEEVNKIWGGDRW
jgi:hypothetical protein